MNEDEGKIVDFLCCSLSFQPMMLEKQLHTARLMEHSIYFFIYFFFLSSISNKTTTKKPLENVMKCMKPEE
jgi:hypothetical protein